MKRTIIIITVIIAALVALILYGGKKPEKVKSTVPEPVKQRDNLPTDARFDKVKLSQSDEKGNKLWKATAESITAERGGEYADLKNSRIIFYTENKPDITVKAPKIRVDYKSKKIILSQGIKAYSYPRKISLSSNELIYNFKTKNILLTGNAVIKNDKMSLTGNQVVGDINLKKLTVKDGAQLIANE